jgi:hypothetical protein
MSRKVAAPAVVKVVGVLTGGVLTGADGLLLHVLMWTIRASVLGDEVSWQYMHFGMVSSCGDGPHWHWPAGPPVGQDR